MASTIPSASLYQVVPYGPKVPARPVRQEEAGAAVPPPARERTMGAEDWRRIEAQAEARAPRLHSMRDDAELPRRTQEALATYRGIVTASQAYDGGELVGLDIHV